MFPSLELHDFAPWFTLVAAVAPAWGAACHAIEVQGEFEWLALRSSEVQLGIENLLTRIEKASDSADFAKLFQNTGDLSDIMLPTSSTGGSFTNCGPRPYRDTTSRVDFGTHFPLTVGGARLAFRRGSAQQVKRTVG